MKKTLITIALLIATNTAVNAQSTYYQFVEFKHYAGYLQTGQTTAEYIIYQKHNDAIMRIVTFGNMSPPYDNQYGTQYVCNQSPCYFDMTIYIKNIEPIPTVYNALLNQNVQSEFALYDDTRQKAYVGSLMPLTITMQQWYNNPLIKYLTLTIIATVLFTQTIAPQLMKYVHAYIGNNSMHSTKDGLPYEQYEGDDTDYE